MVRLFCAVVGVGSVVAVDVNTSETTVGDLKTQIKQQNPNSIKCDAALLQLYLSKAENNTWLHSKCADYRSLKRGETPASITSRMREQLKLTDDTATLDDYFGKTFTPAYHDIHVLVALPSPLPPPLPRIHSETRLKRWRQLATIQGTTSHTGAGCSWSEIKNAQLLAYDRYKQDRVRIPDDDRFQFLMQYLQFASHAMGGYTTDAAPRAHYITSVLILLCSLVNGVTLEDRGNSQFALVSTRRGEFMKKKKTICWIVAATKSGFNGGKAQVLAACDAVAVREGEACVVYGIVTDFITWQLFRCGESGIWMDSSTLSVRSEVLQVDSMRDVCEMIYGALLGHEEIQ